MSPPKAREDQQEGTRCRSPRGAADNNEENLILSNDRRLLTAFRGEFDRLWKKFALNRLPG